MRPQGSASMFVRQVDLTGFDFHRPLRGWVTLATGETVRSKSVQLMSGPRRKVGPAGPDVDP